MKYSLVIPVYKNEDSIHRMLDSLSAINQKLGGQLEAVFVVDGSPDQSYALLRDAIGNLSFAAQLLTHSRNFGSFPAIRSGLAVARGDFFGVMAADLQEPPELFLNFFEVLASDSCDVAIGTRIRRNDPLTSRLASGLFWRIYRKLVVRDMPQGGVDVFGCNRKFRDHLLQLEESRTSLIALVFWLGFRRNFVKYERQVRQEGESSWTFSKKLEYMMDSIFSFTDLPIRLLFRIGVVGSIMSIGLALFILLARILDVIEVPGYATTILVILILGALNLFGLGLVGSYAWRGYENSKRRPLSIVASKSSNNRN
jgi:glycosyltransferase involved in cell wall biosynthesis